jgi:hypothetical protein
MFEVLSRNIFCLQRRRRLAIAFFDKLVLGSFCLLGLELFVACGCKSRYSSLLRRKTAENGWKRVNLLLPSAYVNK